jgi:hypothetical protein
MTTAISLPVELLQAAGDLRVALGRIVGGYTATYGFPDGCDVTRRRDVRTVPGSKTCGMSREGQRHCACDP